jgi:hypothetical protein
MKSLVRMLAVVGLVAMLALAINVGLSLQAPASTANEPRTQAVSYPYLLEQRPIPDGQVWETTMTIGLGVTIMALFFGMLIIIGLGMVNSTPRNTGRMPRYDKHDYSE